MATKKEKQIEKAQKFALKGYFDKAIAEYKSIVAADPNDISLRLRIGELYVKTGLKEEAIKEYSSIGKYNTTRGFYLKAIAVYKQVLKLDNASLEIHNKLADLYTKQRLIADAIGEYSYILNTYEKKGRTNEAFDLLKKMVDIDQENAGLKLRLADMQKKLGYADDALDLYCRVLQKFLAKGKVEKAENLLGDLYLDHPTDERVLQGLVVINREKGDISLFTGYAGELMDLFKEGGELEKLEALCNSVLELAPDNEKAREALAELGDEAGSEPDGTAEEAEPEETLEQSVVAEAGQEEGPEEIAEPEEASKPEEAAEPEKEAVEEGIDLEEAMEPEATEGLEVDAVAETGEDTVLETTLHEEAEEDEDEEEEFFEIDFDDLEDEEPVEPVEVEGAVGFEDTAGPEEVLEPVEAAELEEATELEEASEPEEALKPEEAGEVGVEVLGGGEGLAGSGGSEEELVEAPEAGSVDEPEPKIEPEIEIDLKDITGSIDIEESEEIEISDTEDTLKEEAALEEEGLNGVAGPSETVAGPSETAFELPDAEPSEMVAGSSEPVIEESEDTDLSALTKDELPGFSESDLLEEGELEDITEEPSAGDVFEEAAGFEDAAEPEKTLKPDEASEPEEALKPEEAREVEAEVSGVDEESAGTGSSEDEVAEELLVEISEDAFEDEVDEVIEEFAEDAAGPEDAVAGTGQEEVDSEGEVDGAGEFFSGEMEELGLDDLEEVVVQEQGFSDEKLSLSVDNEEVGALAGDDSEVGGKGNDEDFIDLTKELGIEEALGQLVDSWSDSEESSGMVEEFKAGMGEQLGREDVETHFTLGIAYMEMELFDDAVREFKLSAQDAAFEFNSYARLGQCSVATGNPVGAVGFYIKALAVKGMSDRDRIGAIYELALAYDLAGEQSEALHMMKAVGNLDHDYREVQEKLVEFSTERSYIPGSDDLIEIELM